MICDSCIHKNVCYESEEDREALKSCSDYFNFDEEVKKIETRVKDYLNWCDEELPKLRVGGVENIFSKVKGERK